MNGPHLVQITPPRPMSGRIGRYRPIASIGRGGMSEVYLAVTSGTEAAAGFQKLLVLKLLRQEMAEEPEFVKMFMDEARLAARLNHPNVVQTIEVGQDGDRFFLAMEYLEGQPLHRIVHRSGKDFKLTFGMRLGILGSALAGLEYAHELRDYNGTPLNVVHRDVSPANLFVTYEGQIKLVDFGIAKAMDSNAGTRIGTFKGKAGYIAPEQVLGEAVDRRADIYSAGVVLWELITGRRMWRGSSQMETLKKVVAGDIAPPSSVNPRVPEELERICMKALSLRREDRQPTARALANEIEEFARRRVSPVSEREIGKAVADAFAQERMRIREIIDSQLSRSKPPEEAVELLSAVDIAQEATPSPDSGTFGSGTFGSGPGTVPPARDTEITGRKPMRTWLLVSGAAVGAALVAAVAYWAGGRDKPPTAAAPQANDAPARPSGAPGERAQVAAPAARGVTDTEIKLGMSAAFSGPSRDLGSNMKLGIETALQAANDAGGVHGRKLSLVALDDGYEANRVGETMKDLLEQRRVFAFVGNVGTPTSVIAAPYAAQNRTVFFGAFTGAPVLRQDPPDRYIFNYRASYKEETAQAVKYLLDVRRLQPDQIAVFAQDDSYGDAGFDGVVKALRKRGVAESEILRVGYKRNTVDVERAVTAVMAYNDRTELVRANAQADPRPTQKHPVRAIIMVATYRPAAKFIQKVREYQRMAETLFFNVSFVGSESLAEELKSLGASLCPNVFVTQVVPPFDSGSTGVLRYRDLLAKYQPQAQPGFVSLEGFIVGSLFVEALKRAGPALTTEKLVDALEQVQDYDAGFGTKIGYSLSEHQGSHKVWGTRLDKSCTLKVADLE
jgi:serine/threonine protein kinase/ABC-type branched-subunit amino acid transport system substrate-binding protein